MGRSPCCDKASVKRGPWSQEEDEVLRSFVQRFGNAGNWIALPQKAGLRRCGKSCRLRWLNYLRPALRHGGFTDEEDNLILSLYGEIGSKWSVIASRLPGRTDNDVKNYWNTKLKKRFLATTRETTPPPPPTGGDTIAGAVDSTSETDQTSPPTGGDTIAAVDSTSETDQTPPAGGDTIAAVDSTSESDQTPLPPTPPALANLDTALDTVNDDDELLYKSEQLYEELMGLIQQQSTAATSSPALETTSITTSSSPPLLKYIANLPSSPSPLGTSPTASSAGSSLWPLDMYDTVMLSKSSSSSSSLFEFDDPYSAHAYGVAQLHDSFQDLLASYQEVVVTQGLLYY